MTPLAIADRIEIQELYASYAWAFDSADPQAFAAVFTEDARFASVGLDDIVGRAGLEAFVEDHRKRGRRIVHHMSNLLLEAAPEGVLGKAYVLVLDKRPGQPLRLRTAGTYADELVKVEGRWLFKARAFTPASDGT